MDYQNDAPLRATYNDWHRHAGLRESDIDLLNILVNLSPSQRDMAISFLPDQRSLDYIQDISQRVFAIYEFENAELELDDRFSRIEFADLMTVEHFGEEFSAVACAAEPDSRQHMEQIRLHYCENPVSQAGIKPLSAKIASVRHVQRRIRSKAGDVESRKLGLNGVNDMSSTLISGYQPPLLDSESGTLPQRKSASTLLGVENRESAVSVERVSAPSQHSLNHDPTQANQSSVNFLDSYMDTKYGQDLIIASTSTSPTSFIINHSTSNASRQSFLAKSSLRNRKNTNCVPHNRRIRNYPTSNAPAQPPLASSSSRKRKNTDFGEDQPRQRLALETCGAMEPLERFVRRPSANSRTRRAFVEGSDVSLQPPARVNDFGDMNCWSSQFLAA